MLMVGKATYRLNSYRGNPRDGYYFHQQSNEKRSKANEDKNCFLVALKRAALKLLRTFRTGKNCYLLQFSDFTWLSIKVIEFGRFQNH